MKKLCKWIAFGVTFIVCSIVFGLIATERTDLFGPFVAWCCLVGEIVVIISLVIAYDN